MSGIGEGQPPTSATRTFWLDAQLPPALAQWIRTEHHTDAMHVEELGLHRARDAEIFAEARAVGTVSS